jgi:photosystem II stability/assembly factor-like uncharacterized protein
MTTKHFRVLGLAMAALLPACGAGQESGGGTGTTALSASMVGVPNPCDNQVGWAPIANLSGPYGSGNRMWFIDANQGWIAADSLTILHSVDGGATWVAQMGGTQGSTVVPSLNAIQFVDANRGWACGHFEYFVGATLFRTMDGGSTWTRSSAGIDASFSGRALSFVDSDTGWVAGIGQPGVYVTKDGGVTWTPQPTGISDITAVCFVDHQNGWVQGDGVILHTTDGGLTWTEQFRATPDEGLGGLAFVNATTGWVALWDTSTPGGILSKGILFTSDGGATWTVQTTPETGGIIALDFVCPTQGWGVSWSGTIIHTEDGGRSWVTQQIPGLTSTSNAPMVDVRFLDANVGWALRGDGILFKTTNGGKGP